MSVLQTFNPSWGHGQVVTPGAASASVAIGAGEKSIVLTNLGTTVVYVRVGDSAVVATTADYPVLAGSQVSLTKYQDYTHLAHISPGGAGSLHVIPGEGW